jgi:hypothetical protein
MPAAILLAQALLCADCEAISGPEADACPRCASRLRHRVATWLAAPGRAAPRGPREPRAVLRMAAEHTVALSLPTLPEGAVLCVRCGLPLAGDPAAWPPCDPAGVSAAGSRLVAV